MLKANQANRPDYKFACRIVSRLVEECGHWPHVILHFIWMGYRWEVWHYSVVSATLPRGGYDTLPPVPSQPDAPANTSRDIEPMLVKCWVDVVDGEPTLNQHWFNVSCLLGYVMCLLWGHQTRYCGFSESNMLSVSLTSDRSVIRGFCMPSRCFRARLCQSCNTICSPRCSPYFVKPE